MHQRQSKLVLTKHIMPWQWYGSWALHGYTNLKTDAQGIVVAETVNNV